MHTTVSSPSKTVVIGDDQPFCIIGERINPTGRTAFQEQLRAGELDLAITSASAPLAMAMGLHGQPAWPAITPMTVTRNGNALCLARRFLDLDVNNLAGLATRLQGREWPLRLAIAQKGSMQELLLRHWLASGGINPEREVEFSTLSPMAMQAALLALQAEAEAQNPFVRWLKILGRMAVRLIPEYIVIVLALGAQQVVLQRLGCLDQCQQASGSRRAGAISEQTAHQTLLQELLTCGAGIEQLLVQHGQ